MPPQEPMYCTLPFDAWFSACLTQTGWAAWVQAVGSVAAIGVAILIAWWQRRSDRIAAIEVSRLRAEVAGTSALLKMSPLLGCLRTVADRIQLGTVGNNPSTSALLSSLIDSFPYPTERELLAIADYDPHCTKLLVRGLNLSRQGQLALGLLARQAEIEAASSQQVQHVKDVLNNAIQQFEKAQVRLETLVPHDSPA
jgi:hypothetical protein